MLRVRQARRARRVPRARRGRPAASPPDFTNAIFGAGPITHFDGGTWLLEALDSNTLQLRKTGGGFTNFGFISPTACAAGSAGMSQQFRFASQVGQTLTADLCTEGSPMFVVVNDGAAAMKIFACQRRTGNHNTCQRFF
ncbi:MAG: hypothetical protein R3F60_18870 [bacterium]